jgi:membrane associated rhomboid family serine protease
MGSSFGAPRIRFDWRSFITPAVKILVLTCTGVFVLQTLIELFLPRVYPWFIHEFGLVPRGVVPGLRIWQPLTYIFLHGELLHLFFNMLVLWMFGRNLEEVWGKKRFINYFLLCGVGAGIITIVVKFVPLAWGSTPSDIPTIGASGALYGILIANAILFPDRQVWIFFFLISIPMRVFVIIMAFLEFFSTLGSAGGDNVSHLCHLGGMLVGWLYLRRGSFLYRVRNEMADWRYQRNRRKFDVYMKKNKDNRPGSDHWVN